MCDICLSLSTLLTRVFCSHCCIMLQNVVANRVQTGAVWRPHIRSDEVGVLQLNGLASDPEIERRRCEAREAGSADVA